MANVIENNGRRPSRKLLGWQSLFISILALVAALWMGIGNAHLQGGLKPKQQLAQTKIEPKVLSDLQKQGKVTYFVIMKEQADTSFAVNIKDWNLRGQAVVDALQEVANRTQAPVLAQLANKAAETTPFWVVNAIKVTTSDEGLIRELAARPDVDYIKADETWRIPDPIPGTEEPKVQTVEWGIARIRAPEVWDQFNNRGEGIVVANIDTGVAFNHPALVMQYRGRQPDGTFDHNYNWVDPSRVCPNPLVPCDNAAHGTHTMGTMVGDDGDPGPNQIGVAPHAKWIAAKGCESFSCSFAALLASGQWVLAPTDLNGQNPRPDLRPHIVNNSWSGGPGSGDTFYQMTVQQWRNSGIFPAFANGNFGPGCGTIAPPAAYPESFGVGATDINDNIAGFSGRGPANAFGAILKPQASAPGVNVRSSIPPNGYGPNNGTSMATPHVAGAVALIWSARPSVRGDIEKTFEILQSTARPRLDAQCGPAGPPNNVYGWGIIDVFAAIRSITPMRAEPDRVETCRPNPVATTITVFGGPGLFENDVTLSLAEVSPPTKTITATFDPNPVPRPPAQGSTSRMTINTTSSTPPGTYTLTVQGADGATTATTQVTLIVRSEVPAAPVLQSPANGADGVSERATFTWSATTGATSYRLEIFLGNDCKGTPVRVFDNITATSFTIPAAQALDFFQRYSWRVTAINACGQTASAQCFNFRTQSCSPAAREFAINGGYEQDLAGWVVDASIPPPVVTTERPRTGAKAAKLGVIAPAGTPTTAGDSEIHQTFTIPTGALNARLVFWNWPQSFDTIEFDQQYVRVVPISPPGPTVELMREANNAQNYIRREFSLDAFRGRTIEIHFGVHNDGFPDPTGMFVDDVSVTFQSCGPPDFFITVVPPKFNEVCAGESINFTVGVESLNGPNFTSAVTLSGRNLPPGASVSFAQNPIRPGETTTMTLQTTRPIVAGRYFFDVFGQAVEPPPAEPRSSRTSTFISSNPPNAPEPIGPPEGEVNVSIRPTLSWTEPFVKDQPPVPPGDPKDLTGNAPGKDEILVFGAARYRIQVARDPGFTDLVVDTETPETIFTLPFDLQIATRYFWRVKAINACGESPFSEVRSFITGACFEGWSIRPPVPVTDGPSQPSVVAAAGKLYVIGGGVGAGPDLRINQVWEFDPATDAWTRKTDVPMPGPGSSFGSAVELGGKIYVFGGFSTTILNTLWIYDVAANTWSRGRNLPSDNFGSAVAAIGGKIYLAYGSGFQRQTWEYDPATDNYTRKADAPAIPAPFRVHGEALGNEMHAFAGGFGGTAHVVYNAATDTWRTAPPMPFGVTDPAVVVLGGKFYVIGGRPIARTQIFDPGTNTWSQGPPLPGLPMGLDNTDGDVIGLTIHVVGGFIGTNSTNAHRAFRACSLGAGTSSAYLIPFAVDGDGSTSEIPNERTSLILSNDLSGATAGVTVFFNTPDGSAAGSRTFPLGSNEVLSLTNIIRQLRGAPPGEVQNVKGSLTILSTEPINASVLITNNLTDDQTFLEGQPLGGVRSGFVPLIQLNERYTQVVLSNASGSTANVQLLAYPPTGGDNPVASTSVAVPPRGLVDFADVVTALGLPPGHAGQLSWNSTRPITVFARAITADGGFSGTMPVRTVADGSNTLFVAYVEDTSAFSSQLQPSNIGPITANTTVRFVDVTDPTGGTPGVSSSRDLPVRVNSATVISNIIRWALRDESEVPLEKRGFLTISSPQPVTALAAIIHNASLDPAFTDAMTPMRGSFTPVIWKFEPLSPGPPASSRVAISNPGTAPANVTLMAFTPKGAPALEAPVRIRVVGGGQFFTNDIVGRLGLPQVFLGSLTITSDVPVLVFNQSRTQTNTGAAVPLYPR